MYGTTNVQLQEVKQGKKVDDKKGNGEEKMKDFAESNDDDASKANGKKGDKKEKAFERDQIDDNDAEDQDGINDDEDEKEDVEPKSPYYSATKTRRARRRGPSN